MERGKGFYAAEPRAVNHKSGKVSLGQGGGLTNNDNNKPLAAGSDGGWTVAGRRKPTQGKNDLKTGNFVNENRAAGNRVHQQNYSFHQDSADQIGQKAVERQLDLNSDN